MNDQNGLIKRVWWWYISGAQSIHRFPTWHLWGMLKVFLICTRRRYGASGLPGWLMTCSSFQVLRRCFNKQPKRSKSWKGQPDSTRDNAFPPSASTTAMRFVRRWGGVLRGRRVGFRKFLALIIAKTMYDYEEQII